MADPAPLWMRLSGKDARALMGALEAAHEQLFSARDGGLDGAQCGALADQLYETLGVVVFAWRDAFDSDPPGYTTG